MADFPLGSGRVNRRAFIARSAAIAAGVGLSGWPLADALAQEKAAAQKVVPPLPDPGDVAGMYAARVDGGHQLPAIPVGKLDKRFVRQVVIDPTFEKPGTIVVDTSTHFLYFVLEGKKAIRYGVSLGKSGFDWTGSAVVEFKKAWPVWTPPPEMINRKPELAKYANGMPPGPQSPLGARALYLFKNGQDTMYRLHGSPEWDSIGKNASSGCVRFMNQDIIDLYARVSGPTTVHVRHSMYIGASMFGASKRPTTEPIDAGVPDGAERV